MNQNLIHQNDNATTFLNVFDIPVDPILAPFSNNAATFILDIDSETLASLVSLDLLVPTCRTEQVFDEPIVRFSYWDLIAGTTCMSLLSIGFSQIHSASISDELVDAIASHLEADECSGVLRFQDTMNIVHGALCDAHNIEVIFALPYSVASIARKVALDIGNAHCRCAVVFRGPLSKVMTVDCR